MDNVKLAQSEGHADPVLHAFSHAQDTAAARESERTRVAQDPKPFTEGMGRADTGK
jgi:hypothetical protein